jgi:transposase
MGNDFEISTQSIDHLGLVAGMIDELKIVEVIDNLIPNAKELSHGKAIAAMILNGLGYANKRLYLTPRFFEKKACSLLLGSDITAEMINHDSLSRTLDAAYAFGVSDLFTQISAKSVKVLGLECKQLHLDSTSFHVDGIYNSNDEKPEGVIHITQGYSRDHRPELNQVILNLIVENVAGVPLYMQPMSGNTNDKEGFGVIVKEHITSLKHAQENALLVADSALYSAETIQTLTTQKRPFITRVPSTIKEAKTLLSSVKNQKFEPIDENYRYYEIASQYAGVDQRWFVIESKAFKAKESKTALKNVEKLFEKEEKQLAKLTKEIFYCEAEAIKSLKAFQSSLKASALHDTQILTLAGYSKSGRPFKEQKPDLFTYITPLTKHLNNQAA